MEKRDQTTVAENDISTRSLIKLTLWVLFVILCILVGIASAKDKAKKGVRTGWQTGQELFYGPRSELG